jgi:hypothetical protein
MVGFADTGETDGATTGVNAAGGPTTGDVAAVE